MLSISSDWVLLSQHIHDFRFLKIRLRQRNKWYAISAKLTKEKPMQRPRRPPELAMYEILKRKLGRVVYKCPNFITKFMSKLIFSLSFLRKNVSGSEVCYFVEEKLCFIFWMTLYRIYIYVTSLKSYIIELNVCSLLK